MRGARVALATARPSTSALAVRARIPRRRVTIAAAEEIPEAPAARNPRWFLAGVAGVAIALYALKEASAEEKKEAKKIDYAAVRKDIENILDNPKYDDGSYGPVLLRLAWHASGTYNKADGSGGSNGATMRFLPESGHGANAGLQVARELLEKVKTKYPDLSYADLWTLAGVVAVKALGGPEVPWTPGRVDKAGPEFCPPDGRLPDASQSAPHVRDVFYRMGFNDQEIVALIGAHALGRCHRDRSGYEGPWTNSPAAFSNDFYVQLLERKWTERKWDGPRQFEDENKKLMMTPADLAFRDDPEFRKYVEKYAKDEELFFKDFAAAFGKLIALGVPNSKGGEAVKAAVAPKVAVKADASKAEAKPFWKFW